ncbi:MAG: DUF86 domain-containing protein [Tyzzerella sp.]|nr:DUF86 domain-containing protein [Tyzzerella sp.]
MDNTKDDKYYIQRIKKDLEFIVVHMQNVDIEELNKNEVLLDSMLFRMIQVSENAKKLSDELKETNSYVPWRALAGFRNRIVHDYGNVDLNIVYETLKNDIPSIVDKIENT